jgi:chromosome segregation ATPase
MLNWITNQLEQIDSQVASSVDGPRSSGLPPADGDQSSQTPEISTLSTNLRRAKNQIVTLEEQLSSLEKVHVHLQSELKECEEKNVMLSERLESVESELEKFRNEVKGLERKQVQDSSNFEKAKQNLEEIRENLEKDVTALSQQLSTTQHELSVKVNELSKLSNQLALKEAEIADLESEIAKYREKAVESLMNIGQDASVLSQLEMLESERNRLKDRLAKSQQRIVEIEAASKELEEELQHEIGEAKQQQSITESDLFRVRTQNEALNHEISLLKAQLAAADEALESKYKAQIMAERSQHSMEILRLKEQFSTTSKTGKSTEEQLLAALAEIDALKSEKAAMLVVLESCKKNRVGKQGLVQANPRKERKKIVGLVKLVPKCGGVWVHRVVGRFDAKFANGMAVLGRRPILRLVLILWIVIVHFLLLF